MLDLSYKSDIDDLRESPSIEILDDLLAQDFTNLVVVEPNITRLPNAYQGKPVRLLGLDEAVEVAEVVGVLVGHKQFFGERSKIYAGKVQVDPVGLFRWQAATSWEP